MPLRIAHYDCGSENILSREEWDRKIAEVFEFCSTLMNAGIFTFIVVSKVLEYFIRDVCLNLKIVNDCHS